MKKILTPELVNAHILEGLVYTNPQGRVILVSPDRESIEVVADDAQAQHVLACAAEAIRAEAKQDGRTPEWIAQKLKQELGDLAIPKIEIEIRRKFEEEGIVSGEIVSGVYQQIG